MGGVLIRSRIRSAVATAAVLLGAAVMVWVGLRVLCLLSVRMASIWIWGDDSRERFGGDNGCDSAVPQACAHHAEHQQQQQPGQLRLTPLRDPSGLGHTRLHQGCTWITAPQAPAPSPLLTPHGVAFCAQGAGLTTALAEVVDDVTASWPCRGRGGEGGGEGLGAPHPPPSPNAPEPGGVIGGGAHSGGGADGGADGVWPLDLPWQLVRWVVWCIYIYVFRVELWLLASPG